jgi:hypothetical protein
VGPLFSEKTINEERYHNLMTQFISLPEEMKKKIAGFKMTGRRPTLQTQLLHCKSSLVSALLGVAFGHRDLRALLRQNTSCGDFSNKKFIRITHEAWRD